MSDEPRLLSIEEMDALDGQTVTIIGTGMDALAFRAADDRTYIATVCLGCGTHVGYYEIDPSILVPSGNDLGAAG